MTVRSHKMRLLVGLWLLALLVLQQGFRSLILGILKTPRRESTVDSIDDLVDAIKHRGHTWMAETFSRTFLSLRLDEYSELRKVSNLKVGDIRLHYQSPGMNPAFEALDGSVPDRKLLFKVRKGNRVLVFSENLGRQVNSLYKGVYHVSEKTYGVNLFGFFLHFGSHLVETVNRVVIRVVESGLNKFPVQCLKLLIGELPKEDAPRTASYEVIGASPLFYTYLTLVIGWIISALIFLAEMMVHGHSSNWTEIEPLTCNDDRGSVVSDNEEEELPMNPNPSEPIAGPSTRLVATLTFENHQPSREVSSRDTHHVRRRKGSPSGVHQPVEDHQESAGYSNIRIVSRSLQPRDGRLTLKMDSYRSPKHLSVSSTGHVNKEDFPRPLSRDRK